MPMRRSDRRDDSYENSLRNPTSRSREPLSYHDLKASLSTVRANLREAEELAQAEAQKAEQNRQLFLEAQQKQQSALALYQEEQQRYQSTLALYETAKTEAQSYLTLYSQEQAKSAELLTQYEAAKAESQQYLMLYQEVESQLKFERRSKAGIKSWETRRKRENERLKQEVAEMAVILRDSMSREENALTDLDAIAQRMDRIQALINSAEEDTPQNPIGLLQKFQRIWQAVREILAE
jgi:multidrug efflux pump subunit AcrA (membrane-fusion protein)